MNKIKDFINIAKELGFFEYIDEERMDLPIYTFPTPLVNKKVSVDGGDDTLALFEVFKLTGEFYFKWFPRKGRVLTRVFDFPLTDKDFQVTEGNVKLLILESITLMKNSEYNNTEPTEREIDWWEDEIRQIQTWKRKE